MEWIASIKESVNYIESRILEVSGPDEVASHVNISSAYLQQGFQIMTGYNIGEYIRNRRLYLASKDILNSDEKIIDIALKYGYNTPASFTKAFSRFHDASPSEVKNHEKPNKIFLPLHLSVEISGGANLDVEIVTRDSFTLIGFTGLYTMENCQDISRKWKSMNEEYEDFLSEVREPRNDLERVIMDCGIGEYGVTEYAKNEKGEFRYVFAGRYKGGVIPEGMITYEVPAGTWAVFKCVGILPEAIETLNEQIWNDWYPNNKEYVIDGKCEFEWYGGTTYSDPYTNSDYLCTKWVPVKKKKS